MDKFEQWFNEDCFKEKDEYQNQVEAGVFIEVKVVKDAWRESAKQKDVEIDGLNAIIGQQDVIIENLEVSVRSFTDSNVDLVAGEREQYGDLPSEVLITLRHARTFITSRQQMHKAGVELHDDLINRIEKDSSGGSK